MAQGSKLAIDVRSYDVVVIGAGVAGLAFSLALPEGWRVALLTKGVLGESNTRYAQGGISAAIGPDDSTQLHEEDTLVAGAGLCDPAAVRALVDGAPAAVDRLLAIGPSSIAVCKPAKSCWAARPPTAAIGYCTPAATPPAQKSSARWSPQPLLTRISMSTTMHMRSTCSCKTGVRPESWLS